MSGSTKIAGMILQQTVQDTSDKFLPIDGEDVPYAIVLKLLDRADSAVSKSLQAYKNTIDSLIKTWAYTQSFRLVSATRNADGAITTASLEWPDGGTGTFTTTSLSDDFPGAIDAWTATYVSGPVSKTITQPAVTRNSEGAVMEQPAIIIS